MYHHTVVDINKFTSQQCNQTISDNCGAFKTSSKGQTSQETRGIQENNG